MLYPRASCNVEFRVWLLVLVLLCTACHALDISLTDDVATADPAPAAMALTVPADIPTERAAVLPGFREMLAQEAPAGEAKALGPKGQPGMTVEMTPKEILKRNFSTIGNDVTTMTMWPYRHPQAMLRNAGALAVLVATDRESTEFLQNEIEPLFNYHVSDLGIADFGSATDSWVLAMLPAWYVGSLGAKHPKGQVAATLGIKAATYSYVYAHLLGKALTGRTRPTPDLGAPTARDGYTKDPYDWGNLHAPYFGIRTEATSFPSFHYTLYFSVARVYERVYGNSWIPYTVAAAMIGADMKGHHHWVSDCVAGAVIGHGIGTAVVDSFFGLTEPTGEVPKSFNLYPQFSGDGSYGLVLERAF